MRIGSAFREFYQDPQFAEDLRTGWLPWLLDGHGPAGDPPVDLGDDVLDLAAGAASRLPRERVRGRLTVVEPEDYDPTSLPWPDATFSAVMALLVLQHLPDADAQDAALAEWARVLRPDGVLVGLNPIEGPHFHRLDPDGLGRPVDPMTFPERLRRAGFVDARVRVWSLVGFRATPSAVTR